MGETLLYTAGRAGQAAGMQLDASHVCATWILAFLERRWRVCVLHVLSGMETACSQAWTAADLWLDFGVH